MRELLNCAMDIGEQMLISGAEVHRVEDSMNRICASLGATRVDCFIITSSMVITVRTPEDKVYTETRRIKSVGTDFNKLDKLNGLSRRICTSNMTACEIRGELSRIKSESGYPFWLTCIAYAAIAAAFSSFFGGVIEQVIAAFFIGALIRLVVEFAERTIGNLVFSKFLSALAVTALAYLFLWIGLISRVDEVIIGNIMLIIPGLGFTNALRDLFTGDSIAGALRSLEAALSAVSIAAGYVIFVLAIGGTSTTEYIQQTDVIIQIIAATFGSLGFAVLFNIKGIKLIATAVGGGLGWALFSLLNLVLENEPVRYFLVAVSISLYAEIMARALKAPATIFIAPSLIPLVPGASLYYTMAYALGDNSEFFTEKALSTVSCAAALAVGVIVSAVVMQLFTKAMQYYLAKRKLKDTYGKRS